MYSRYSERGGRLTGRILSASDLEELFNVLDLLGLYRRQLELLWVERALRPPSARLHFSAPVSAPRSGQLVDAAVEATQCPV